MASQYNSLVLLKYLRDLIQADADFMANVGNPAPICMVGDLDQWAADETLAADVPAVFVQPDSVDINFQTVDGKRYQDRYFFRVVYVDRIAEGTTHESNRLKAEYVASAITKKIRGDGSPTLTLVQAQLVWIRPTRIEFRPAEDLFAAAKDTKLFAATVVVEARLLSWNTTS